MEKPHRPVRAAVMLFMATSVWGGSFLAMKALGLVQEKIMPGAGSWFLTSLSLSIRFGVSALCLACWCGPKLATITRLELSQGLGLGIFGGLGILLQMDGVQYTAASTSAFLTGCYCIFIPVTLALHRRKFPGAVLAAGSVMALAGMMILSNIDFRAFRIGRGELESILGSLLFTGQILWLERPVYRVNRNAVASFVMFATVAVVVLPVLLTTGVPARQWVAVYASGPALGLIGFLTFGCTLATYTVMNYWQPHLPATQAGLIYCCEPLFTSVFALFIPAILSTAFQIQYPNESITARLLLGGTLITAANLLALWPSRPLEKS
jgi:drug/metabolite transporter (DMT)-like permease